MNLLKRFLFLFPSLIILLFPANVLVISDGVHSHTSFLGEKEIKISYIHSVQRSEIIEELKANKTGLYVTEMWWKDFGAGLPEDLQYLENGYYVKKVNISLGKSLSFWFIPLNHAKISVNEEVILSPTKETLVNFNVRKCPLILVIIGRC
ncbi:DUF1850 domain-containing protein [Thermococcus sp. 2319x1]|uniref:DUF1850 domain-containing protein n=1 Tax=Thermococcus sp. 2319x1 TaxID=1674923 RepID=UPI001E5EA337|nr:DUF1850 domain-containing protein [Thermococcus sp. 2319x1]